MNRFTGDIIKAIKNGSISDEEAEILLKKKNRARYRYMK